METDTKLLSLFFSYKFENVQFAYLRQSPSEFDKAAVLNYVHQLCAISYRDFVQYIKDNPTYHSYSSNDITQCSNPENCHRELCKAFKRAGDKGLTTQEVAYYLYNDDLQRSDNTMQRYGRDQVNAARQLGLTRYDQKWYLSAIGKVFLDLNEKDQQSIMSRCLLRDPFYAKIVLKTLEKDIAFLDYTQELSDSSIVRRRSCVKFMFDIIAKANVNELSFHKLIMPIVKKNKIIR